MKVILVSDTEDNFEKGFCPACAFGIVDETFTYVCPQTGTSHPEHCPAITSEQLEEFNNSKITLDKAIKLFEDELSGGKCGEYCVKCNANEMALNALKIIKVLLEEIKND